MYCIAGCYVHLSAVPHPSGVVLPHHFHVVRAGAALADDVQRRAGVQLLWRRQLAPLQHLRVQQRRSAVGGRVRVGAPLQQQHRQLQAAVTGQRAGDVQWRQTSQLGRVVVSDLPAGESGGVRPPSWGEWWCQTSQLGRVVVSDLPAGESGGVRPFSWGGWWCQTSQLGRVVVSDLPAGEGGGVQTFQLGRVPVY